jgi:hypothetical protein
MGVGAARKAVMQLDTTGSVKKYIVRGIVSKRAFRDTFVVLSTLDHALRLIPFNLSAL